MAQEGWPMHLVPSGGMSITPVQSPDHAVPARLSQTGEGTPATLVRTQGMAVFVINPDALPPAWRAGLGAGSEIGAAREGGQEQCPNCRYYKVRRHTSRTQGRIRPGTNTLISDEDYKALLSRVMGVGMVPGLILGVVLFVVAFNPVLAMYHEPLSNAPLTSLSLLAIFLLVTVGVTAALAYAQLGPASLQRWRHVTRRLSYYECQNCGKTWAREESDTPS